MNQTAEKIYTPLRHERKRRCTQRWTTLLRPSSFETVTLLVASMRWFMQRLFTLKFERYGESVQPKELTFQSYAGLLKKQVVALSQCIVSHDGINQLQSIRLPLLRRWQAQV